MQNIIYGFGRGFVDSLRGFVLIFTLSGKDEAAAKLAGSASRDRQRPGRRSAERPPPLGKRLVQCGGLNGGVLLCSMVFFHYLVLPTLGLLVTLLFGEADTDTDRFWIWSITSKVLTVTFGTLWVLPIFCISRVINCIWFQDIADAAYRTSQGRVSSQLSLSILVADTLFSVFAQALFLIQGTVVNVFIPIPALGYLVSLLHMCLLYALYSFEYKWFNMGWEMHKRLAFIETEWPYFVGFGLPLALLTQAFDSYIINGCMFSILFPVFIISGNEAEPVTGLCKTRLQLFTPVIMVSNMLFRRTVSSSSTSARGATPARGSPTVRGARK